MNTLPDIAPLPPAAGLSRLQKAAVIYRMLGALGMALPDDAFTPEEKAQLSAAIDGLGSIAPSDLAAVVDEFLTSLSPAPPETSLPLLPELPELPMLGSFDPAGGPSDPAALPEEDPWERVTERDDAVLLAILGAEAPEVGAVVLSKLKVARAADLLGQLPGPLARRITYAVSLVSGISPDTVGRIGAALAGELGREAPRAFTGGPVERVGALLNFSRAATRNEVLEGLDETDPGFAEAVRKSIFTFANIPARVGLRDVPKILRKVDQKVLITALVAARASEELQRTADFILANISQRMAEALRAEAEELGEVTAADGEAAMTGVVAAIRELEEAGEIYLVAEEE